MNDARLIRVKPEHILTRTIDLLARFRFKEAARDFQLIGHAIRIDIRHTEIERHRLHQTIYAASLFHISSRETS
ncbi:hypothetical protein D3C86_1913930 [compost metagenome]